MLSRPILALCLLAAAAPVGLAQTGSQPLTIEAIFSGELGSPSPSEIRWTPGGDVSFFLSASESGRDLWLLDAQSGERRILVGADVLGTIAPSVFELTEDERERTRWTRFGVPDYHWAPDGRSILFTTTGEIRMYDLEREESTRLAPEMKGILDPKFSPDGTQVSFLYEHDVWVVPSSGGEPRRLTHGGSELILHGELDWVYPEELGVRTGYHWSPDGRHIAFLELDETLVPIYPITEEVSRQASVDLQRYPKPGDPNPRARVGIVEVRSGRTAWIDRADEYVPRIQWVNDDTLSVQLLNRGQDRLELVHVEPSTGRSRSVLVDEDPYWVDVSDDLTFLDGGERFLWTSHRTGFRHIYLHSSSGSMIRALTEGDWQVFEIAGVDEENALVYFTANRDNPIGRDLYRVRLDGTGLEKLTKEKGSHVIDMSPEATAYLDRFSSMTDPGRTTLERVSESPEIVVHEEEPLDDYDLVEPEYQLLDAPDGAKIGILLMKPKELEAGRKYPLVVYVYGMLGVPTIRDSWGGSRYLFHQFLVQQGYVVAHIDDRTSAVWGHRYAALGDHNLGPVAIRDHEIAVEHLTSLPYVDERNTGVWGWSGGGFTTTFHMTHSKVFKIGVAGAPVTDWHLYDSIYTERYMGLPSEDPEAYERTSAIEGAASYEGRLLLIHGTHDDNVHPQNTMMLIDALIANRKKFDLMLYPNKTHGIRGTDEVIHLWTTVFDFMERHLKETPR